MKKMLVGDNLEMNKIIISEIFGKEYEIIYTSSSEEFLHLLMHYKDDADVILVNQYIAKSLSSDIPLSYLYSTRDIPTEKILLPCLSVTLYILLSIPTPLSSVYRTLPNFSV